MFSRYGPPLLMGFCVLLPLKLSLAYIFGIPFILLWLFYAGLKELFSLSFYGELQERYAPLLLFFLYSVVSSIVGLDPVESSKELLSLAFFSLLIPAVVALIEEREIEKFLGFLLFGQTLASLHSILESSSQGTLGRLFVGTVSESGQLSIVFVICCGYALEQVLEAKERLRTKAHALNPLSISVGVFFFLAFLFLGFSKSLGLSATYSLVLTVAVIALFCINAFKVLRNKDVVAKGRYFLIQSILPACGAALLVNLKRGPWLGVICALLVLFFRSFRAGALLPIVVVITLATCVSPISTRLLQSVQDFQISGGREIIWQIGAELSLRFPLGIGFGNSQILQAYSAEIPPQLTHFHNNALNILVETGWIGLSLFAWWIARNISSAFSFRRLTITDCVPVALSAALFSWQVAGIVEYNVGDSEVAYLAFLLVALQIKIAERSAVSLPAEKVNMRAAA
jgi:hypothetical protein